MRLCYTKLNHWLDVYLILCVYEWCMCGYMFMRVCEHEYMGACECVLVCMDFRD